MAVELRADIRVRSEVIALTRARGKFALLMAPYWPSSVWSSLGELTRFIRLEGDAAGAVYSVNDLDDFSRFHDGLENAKSVVVIGAGLIGCEFANDLASRKIKASVIDPATWPFPDCCRRWLDGNSPKRFRQRVSSSISASRQRASGTTLAATVSNLPTAGRIPVRPDPVRDRPTAARTALAQGAGIVCQRGIVTNRFLETNLAGIYATGDCAEIAGLNLPFVLPIMYQARALAKTLAGTPVSLHYPAMPVVVKTPRLSRRGLPASSGGGRILAVPANGWRAAAIGFVKVIR